MNKPVKKTKEVSQKPAAKETDKAVKAPKAEAKTPTKETAKAAAKTVAEVAKTAKVEKSSAKTQEKPAQAAAPKIVKPIEKVEKPKVAGKPSSTLAHGVGRRKAAVARVWLKRGKGNLVINDKNYVDYFDTDISRSNAYIPFKVYQPASNYDVAVNVCGGGLYAQADAVKLGIARALVSMNEEIRPMLRQHGLLTVDSRVKERKKYGQKAARRKFQFVKR